ncbi:hypothetical protein C8J57DRAFT_1217170 [Mycena rebaudengoi]|nr:hypothetical protein C8J57DRAFT_1217170 [Mycena rebaudengoi]
MATNLPTDASHFDWGDPRVIVQIPPTHQPIPLAVPPIGSLDCDPVGTYNLRRALGANVPGFDRHRHCYCTSNMAWTASGASEDGHHFVASDHFFPEFLSLHDVLPTGNEGRQLRTSWGDQMRKLIFDLYSGDDLHCSRQRHHCAQFTSGSRATEGASLPSSSPPRRPSGDRSKAERKWNLTQHGHVYPVHLPTVLIPSPTSPRSAHYLFPGRPVGQLTLSAPMAGPILLGVSPDNDDNLAFFDEPEPSREDDKTLVASMQADLDDCVAELGAMSAKVLRLESNTLSTAFSPTSSQHLPSMPTCRAPPPAYVPSAPVSPVSPTGHLSASRQRFRTFAPGEPIQLPLPASGPGSITCPIPLTDAFLAEYGLKRNHDMLIIIMRFVSAVEWREQIFLRDSAQANLFPFGGGPRVPYSHSQQKKQNENCRHPPAQSREPLTSEEKKEKHNASKDKQDSIDEAVAGAAGMNAPELHEEYHEEYYALSEEEKEQLVERFAATKIDASKIRRDDKLPIIAALKHTILRSYNSIIGGLIPSD